MPIRPEMRARYPRDWAVRSRFVRFVRAGGRCEWCGAAHGQPHPVTGSVVVLTTFAESQRVLAALDAGAVGYMLKDSSGADLIADFLTTLDARITAEKSKLTATRQFKKALLQRMFV